jgi:hypothetical protein
MGAVGDDNGQSINQNPEWRGTSSWAQPSRVGRLLVDTETLTSANPETKLKSKSSGNKNAIRSLLLNLEISPNFTFNSLEIDGKNINRDVIFNSELK